jgi:hypothetical protein
MKNKKITIHYLLTILLAIVTLTSCSESRPESTLHPETLAEYQAKVNFPVVLPLYLPKNCVYSNIGVQSPPYGLNNECFSIGYYDYSKGYNVHIFEAGEFKEIKPTFSKYSYLDFSTIQVLEQQVIFAPSGNYHPPQTFKYSWNDNGIFFEVTIEGYEQNERHNVVRSLINQ